MATMNTIFFCLIVTSFFVCTFRKMNGFLFFLIKTNSNELSNWFQLIYLIFQAIPEDCITQGKELVRLILNLFIAYRFLRLGQVRTQDKVCSLSLCSKSRKLFADRDLSLLFLAHSFTVTLLSFNEPA